MRVPHLSAALLALAALAGTAAPASGVTPYRVRDINPEPQAASSSPRDFVPLGGAALFVAGPLDRWELWRTDGTAVGTYNLHIEAPYRFLAAVGGRLFYFPDPTSAYSGLRVTDGTVAGTFPLSDVPLAVPDRPGSTAWVPARSTLYFAATAQDGPGPALWRTDGTPAGTYAVTGAAPGEPASDPRELTAFQGRVYFVAGGPSGGPVLWRSDGTAQGTAPVPEAAPAATEGPLYRVGPRLAFVGRDAAHGAELWVSDGTLKGTHLLVDLVPGAGSPSFSAFATHDGRLYFVAALGSAPPQLWVTDGTAVGTRALTGFAAPSVFVLPQASPAGRFVFAASDPAHGLEPWATDGTAAGTARVRDLCPGACSGLSWPAGSAEPAPAVLHAGRLYFAASNPALGQELWATDGTRQGTRPLGDLCPGSCSSAPGVLISTPGRLYFRAWDGRAERLWATDGTWPGTVRVGGFGLDLGLEGAPVGSGLVFGGADDRHGRELWRTDGTPGGTFLLADLLAEDLGGSFPSGLMALGADALFFADDGVHGYELWRSDGTAAGTALVADLQPGPWPPMPPQVGPWQGTASRVFFFLESYPSGAAAGGPVKFPRPPKRLALWTSDGTAAGTFRLTPDGVFIQYGPALGRLPLSPLVFFSANDGTHGAEPWVTDGTAAGTRLLADLAPRSASSSPAGFTAFQRQIWFVTHGTADRLWRSDGTAAVQVGLDFKDVGSLTAFDRRLWFLTGAGGTAGELWSTDGTAEGTGPRVELPFRPQEMFSDGVRLYLAGGSQTWVSDGTPEGTRELTAAAITSARAFCGSRLFFSSPDGGLSVTDGTPEGTRLVSRDAGGYTLSCVGSSVVSVTSGGRLWTSDGTAAGTRFQRQLTPDSGGVLELLQAGPRTFLRGWDARAGWELWAVRE